MRSLAMEVYVGLPRFRVHTYEYNLTENGNLLA
jgi:hypothetical protein